MQKLLQLKKDYEREGFHLQRLYKRRKQDRHGVMRSTFGMIMNFDRIDDDIEINNAKDTSEDSQQKQEQITYDGGGAIFDIDDIIFDGGDSSFN